MNIEKLKLSDLKQLRKESLKAVYYQQTDLACNIDYIVNSIESDIVQSNISLIESILLFDEH